MIRSNELQGGSRRLNTTIGERGCGCGVCAKASCLTGPSRKHGLSISSLYAWSRQAGQSVQAKSEPVDFKEVSLCGLFSSWEAEVTRPHGLTNRLSAQIAPEVLERLLNSRPC